MGLASPQPWPEYNCGDGSPVGDVDIEGESHKSDDSDGDGKEGRWPDPYHQPNNGA